MQLTSEQIQRLLIEKITGTISLEDSMAIEQLLAEDEHVQQQWLRLQHELQEAQAQGFSVDIDTEQRWQQIKPLLKIHNRVKVISLIKMAAVAAVLVAVVVGGYLLAVLPSASPVIGYMPTAPVATKHNSITLSMDNGKTINLADTVVTTFQFGGATIEANKKRLAFTSSPAGVQQWSTLSVPAALDYKMVLGDGTEVWLNAETKLRFPLHFSSGKREVYIDGEAYFKVAKNRRRPFIVHTPKTDILVTGTQFNVNTYNADRIKTALVEGSVIAKSSGHRQVDLKPGFEVIYNPKKGFRTKTFDENKVLSWMKGEYYFHNTPLQDLAKILSRWYNITVQFENEALQNKTFSGELLKHQSLQLFLDNLRLSADIHSYIKDGVVYFQ